MQVFQLRSPEQNKVLFSYFTFDYLLTANLNLNQSVSKCKSVESHISQQRLSKLDRLPNFVRENLLKIGGSLKYQHDRGAEVELTERFTLPESNREPGPN